MKNGKKLRTILSYTIGLFILLAVIIVIVGYLFISKPYQGEKQWIFIPQNATNEMIKDTLVTHLKESGERIYLIWNTMGGKPSIAHGAYRVDNGEKELEVAKRILKGNQTPLKITINNMRTMQQFTERLSHKFEWGNDDFINACDSILPVAGFKRAQYPAAFLPDTYEFYWTTKPHQVVERLLGYRNQFWSDDRRAKAKSLNLTPIEVSIVASITEEETNKRDERPMVARLYLNRLRKGMMLQADPTVKFAVGDFAIRRITNRHLNIESPYNTYKHTGLPPGPIRIAEKSSIDAVLNAPMHNYIYMCAKEDFSGYHNFATDYVAHQRNASRYQAELNRRKIYK